MAIISLLALAAAIIIGTVKKINIGIMGIITACILAVISGISAGELAAGFGSLLFLRLLSIQLLICIAQSNGTMDVLAKKLVKIGCEKNIRLLPIILFVALLICNVAGIDVIFLVTPFLIAIAMQLKMHPLKVMFPLLLVFQGASCSPLYATGANMLTLAQQSGIQMNNWNSVVLTCITSAIMFVIFYFVFGWHKTANQTIEGIDTLKFNRNQILTLLGFVAFVIMTLVLKLDTMIAPAIIAVILLLAGAAEPKKAVGSIPWNVLIMIGGMSVLAGVVIDLGGVDLLSEIIANVAGPVTASPLMVLIAGIMSLFSSGNGVVMPTLIPTIPGIVAAGASGQAAALVIAVSIGAITSATSPMSTIGANMVSCYGSIYNPTDEERTKFFNQCLLFTIICLVIQILFALIGIYKINILG